MKNCDAYNANANWPDCDDCPRMGDDCDGDDEVMGDCLVCGQPTSHKIKIKEGERDPTIEEFCHKHCAEEVKGACE